MKDDLPLFERRSKSRQIRPEDSLNQLEKRRAKLKALQAECSSFKERLETLTADLDSENNRTRNPIAQLRECLDDVINATKE
jgi:molecular chaperone GrpE (heat shock protein)